MNQVRIGYVWVAAPINIFKGAAAPPVWV